MSSDITATVITVPSVYTAISHVSDALSHEGISKDRSNQQQGYKFRGIDDCLNAISSLLPLHGLVVIPTVLERDVVERQTKQGGNLFYVTVKVQFSFVSTLDGSRHDAVLYGEAMDSADKATNKAMSAAYKYCVLLTFCVPTEAEDADSVTHDVLHQPAPKTFEQKFPAKPTLVHPAPKPTPPASVPGVDLGKTWPTRLPWHNRWRNVRRWGTRLRTRLWYPMRISGRYG